VTGDGKDKIITEYRQTEGNADGDKDNIVGTGWGWVQNILQCHPLPPLCRSYTMLQQFNVVNFDACLQTVVHEIIRQSKYTVCE